MLAALDETELFNAAKVHGAPYELVRLVAKTGKLPVPNFSAGGIATPADASLMMQLGAETVFVGSGIFMKEGATPLDVDLWDKEEAEIGLCTSAEVGTPRNPEERAEAVSRARAIVLATLHYSDPKIVAEASEAIIGSMKGLAAAAIEQQDLMQTRGW
jgi:pyridoxal 5'-phosphate synthase pdxS subunit